MGFGAKAVKVVFGFWFGLFVGQRWKLFVDFGLGYLWVNNGGMGFDLDWLWVAVEDCDFGLDQQWVGGRGLCILVWISDVGLLWFKQRFCGFAMV